MRRGPRREPISVRADIRTGLDYVRRHVWLWATFATAAIAYLLFMGPAEVLLPYLVKNELGGSASDLGLVFAAGGIGSVGCAVVLGQRGLPRRDITFMYLAWTLATVAVAGYGLASAVWQLMLASLAFNALETAGHDRVGDRQAAPRARRAPRPRVEPRLADLDRPAAGVVRADRPGQRRDRRPDDARRRGPDRRRGDVRRAAAPGHARRRGAGPTARSPRRPTPGTGPVATATATPCRPPPEARSRSAGRSRPAGS